MNPDLTAIFNTLRPFFSAHADKCVVVHDDAARFHLGTHEVRERDGYRTDFGGVVINKAYVSVHLMPVYIHPDMLENLSSHLRKRMQGKSCFNFKQIDEPLFEELHELVDAGVSRFTDDGRL